MEHLEYNVTIGAPAKVVWDTMLKKETYEQWVAKSWPDSSYKGEWAKGEEIAFCGPDGGGTLAEIVEFIPYERVLARHIALLGPGGTRDTTSDTAKTWVGITEEYRFKERDGSTTVTVHMKTTPEWRKMLDDGWPTALQELKRIAEEQMTMA